MAESRQDLDGVDLEINELIDRFLIEVVGRAEQPSYDDESTFISDLLLDSLDFLSLLSEVEERWDLSISDSEMTIERFVTVGALRAYVHQALAARPAG